MSDVEKKEIRDVIVGIPTLYFVGRSVKLKLKYVQSHNVLSTLRLSKSFCLNSI